MVLQCICDETSGRVREEIDVCIAENSLIRSALDTIKNKLGTYPHKLHLTFYDFLRFWCLMGKSALLGFVGLQCLSPSAQLLLSSYVYKQHLSDHSKSKPEH